MQFLLWFYSLLVFSAAVLIGRSPKLEHITRPPRAHPVTYLQYLNLFSQLGRLQGFFRSTS